MQLLKAIQVPCVNGVLSAVLSFAVTNIRENSRDFASGRTTVTKSFRL